nr:YqzL family protein [Cohnella algarum]
MAQPRIGAAYAGISQRVIRPGSERARNQKVVRHTPAAKWHPNGGSKSFPSGEDECAVRNFTWHVFTQTGDIEAYLLYKEMDKLGRDEHDLEPPSLPEDGNVVLGAEPLG